jgi:cardiolipin synthase
MPSRVMRWSQLPNLRVAMVGPTVFALLDGRFGAAIAWVCLAGLSDGLDGFLAKRFRWQSRIGGLIDPLADKLLLVSIYACLAFLDLVPIWLVVVVVGRDLIIVSGAIAYNLLVGPLQPEPSRVSKLNTATQLLFVVTVMGHEVLPGVPAGAVIALGAGVMVTSVVSGFDYVIRWARRAAGHGMATGRA